MANAIEAPKVLEWHDVDGGVTHAMNTATGVSLHMYDNDSEKPLVAWHVAGERWDADAGRFVAIVDRGVEVAEACAVELDRLAGIARRRSVEGGNDEITAVSISFEAVGYERAAKLLRAGAWKR